MISNPSLELSAAQRFRIQQFMQQDMPVAFPRLLTGKERAVIHRILSMLQSDDRQENYYVMANLRDVVFVVWLNVHHPELRLTKYSEGVAAIEAEVIPPRECRQIDDFKQFIVTAFAGHGLHEILSLQDWIDEVPSRHREHWQQSRRMRFEATGLSLQEAHIAYLEYMLANA